MIGAKFIIAEGEEEEDRHALEATSQKLDQIQGGFVGPMHIFKYQHRGCVIRLQILEQGRKHRRARQVLFEELGQTPLNLGSDIVEGAKRAWGE